MRNNPTKKPYASTPQHFKSSSPARRAVPRSRRSPEISARRRLFAALAPIVALLPLAAALGATPAPRPSGTRGPQHPARIDVTKVQPKSLLPKHAEHTEYVVEINKLGQVARVASGRGSDNPTFNAQTYGNALQTFIRTPDGHVVLGTYRLTYDFDPKTARVKRDVTLVRQGGVNPDAKGAAVELLDKAHAQPAAPNISPGPMTPIDPRTLPDLKGVIEPAPTPSAH